MAYCAASDVAALHKNILSGGSNFTTSTCPTLAAVNFWLSSGCSVIESTLIANKVSLPVPATAPLYFWLSDLNLLYAAAKIEMSRTLQGTQMGERTRGQMFDKLFWDGLGRLVGLGSQALDDMTGTGAGGYTHTPIYVGGIYDSDKDDYDEDTDRVVPRFHRGQFMGQFDITASKT
jgi:hypothetical protein